MKVISNTGGKGMNQINKVLWICIALFSLILFPACEKDISNVKKYRIDNVTIIDSLWEAKDSLIRFRYDDEGRIIDQVSLKSETKNGASILFHENGNINIIENYWKGQLHGISKEYDENKILMRTSYFYKDTPLYYKDSNKEGAKPLVEVPDTVLLNQMVKVYLRFIPKSFNDDFVVKMGLSKCINDTVTTKLISFDPKGLYRTKYKFDKTGRFCFRGTVSNELGWKEEFEKEILVIATSNRD